MREADRTRASAAKGAPLEILFVTSDKYPPFRPAAKAIFSEGLVNEGHRIDWVMQAADPKTPHGPRNYRGGVAHVAPTNAGAGRLGRLKKYWADFTNDLVVIPRLLRQRTYTLVQVKDKYLGALVAIAAGKLYGVPVFYWLAYPHAEASLYAAENGVARYAVWYRLRGLAQRWLLYRIIMPACAHVFVQSEQMRADLTREGIPAHKMTAVPSSINLAELDAGLNTRADVEAALAGRACEAIPDPDASLVAGPPPAPGVAARAEPVSTDAHTIVYLGTLLRERKLDFLVAVLANVRRRVPDARLVFIGRGEMPEDEDLLLGEAERLGVADAVRITGWLPMQIAWQHVRGAGACVSPYYPVPILLSTSPTKLIEYMALGKAVVANDHPEQSLVLRRSGAGLLCGWDADEFADAIVLLLKHPSVAESMGRAGRRFVEAHRTHSTMVGLVASRYYDVLGTFAERKRTAKAAVPADGSGWLRKASRKEHLGKAE